MKRLVLLFAGLLIGLTTASATEQTNQKPEKHLDISKQYRYAQPIMFMERGVEFLIFPDGSFDFNTHTLNGYYDDVYYKNNSRRGSVNATYRGPNVNVSFSSNRVDRGVQIIHDRDGKVRRIGNVFLNYDRYGNITRAGSVYIRYSRGRNATVAQVGGLRVNYNRWGEIVNMRGQVNRYSDYCNFCGATSCSVNHLHNDRDRHYNEDNFYHNDDNYYYYKQHGKVKKQKKNKR
jgi:hypothetical protein